ncbi:MAG: serine/threonine protein phosphatase [Candidatus Adiutrix sp.]|jgi:serine/threonine protein phosphatase 1|nr:serine/threonine protein phosphatase [Candidatus Adiutrix sp.]
MNDRRYFVVGDIHGCYLKLRKLLERLDWTPGGDDLLIFLGDYIDRGSQSYEVVDTLADLADRAPNIVTLMGNHEEMFLKFISGEIYPPLNDNGFSATVRNYTRPDQNLTLEHLGFLRGLLPCFETDQHIFVHAGLQPGLPLASQSLEDMLWIRDEFLQNDYDFGRLVVFGHTPFKQPFMAPGRLGLDTGAVFGGPLTCAVLPELRFITAD